MSKTISLIIPTCGRIFEINRLLKTLASFSSPAQYEIVISDMSGDTSTGELIEKTFSSYPIKCLTSSRVCASRARNLGAKAAQGEWLMWPDDDAALAADFEANASSLINVEGEGTIIVGANMDFDGRPHYRYLPTCRTELSPYDLLFIGIEYAILTPSGVFNVVGGFNESQGPGSSSSYQAGEGTDFLLRAYRMGFKIIFHPSLKVFHQRPNLSVINLTKEKNYAEGMAYTMINNDFSLFYKARYATTIIRSIFASILRLKPINAWVNLHRFFIFVGAAFTRK